MGCSLGRFRQGGSVMLHTIDMWFYHNPVANVLSALAAPILLIALIGTITGGA